MPVPLRSSTPRQCGVFPARRQVARVGEGRASRQVGRHGHTGPTTPAVLGRSASSCRRGCSELRLSFPGARARLGESEARRGGSDASTVVAARDDAGSPSPRVEPEPAVSHHGSAGRTSPAAHDPRGDPRRPRGRRRRTADARGGDADDAGADRYRSLGEGPAPRGRAEHGHIAPGYSDRPHRARPSHLAWPGRDDARRSGARTPWDTGGRDGSYVDRQLRQGDPASVDGFPSVRPSCRHGPHHLARYRTGCRSRLHLPAVAVGSAAAGVVALGMGAGRAPVDRTVAVNAASRCRAAASRVGLSTRPG